MSMVFLVIVCGFGTRLEFEVWSVSVGLGRVGFKYDNYTRFLFVSLMPFDADECCQV